MRGFGGVEETKDAFEWFRKQVVAEGLLGVHLQMTLWGELNFKLSDVDGGAKASTKEVIERLGFDSVTHEAIDDEFERILPVIRQGGYVPGVDQQVAPSISLDDYKYI